jgi:ketosteroid isomerase-like protein
MTTKLKLAALFFGFFIAALAQAQEEAGDAADDPANDAADVWATIERQWTAVQEGQDDWTEELLTDDFSGWGKVSPAPRSKASTRMWDEFNRSQGRTVEHELYPLSIVVHGDVAVAHYLYTVATQDNEDKLKVRNGRYSDILVRTGDGWRFLAWHGGEDD